MLRNVIARLQVFLVFQESSMIIHAGYGSAKDISMYASVGLRPDQIHIVGKPSRKQQANFLVDGEQGCGWWWRDRVPAPGVVPSVGCSMASC